MASYSDDETTSPARDANVIVMVDGKTPSKYQKVKKVGEGTFAVVYEGQEISTGRRVALKRIRMGPTEPDLDISAIRELRYLPELDHPNIVPLLDVYSQRQNLYLVLEFYDADLLQLIKDKSVLFSSADVKSWLLMILRALAYCHQRNILHRDLKPNNLLIGPDGQLKLADFGLARSITFPIVPMTSQVVTRWYRSPELLWGAQYYGPGVDIWAAGCIFAELMLRTPFIHSDSDCGQIITLCKALGAPRLEDWPEMTKLPGYFAVPASTDRELDRIFTAAPKDALDLLNRMLQFNPEKRISAQEALAHPYFTNEPRPTVPDQLPKPSVERKGIDLAREQVYRDRLESLSPKVLFKDVK